jgi:phospholipid/cholesterol/gamma-HCH transport system substrate-binding protein
MKTHSVHVAVGLFMTIGIALATAVIIWLGASSILDRGTVFVTYFDESVQGLSVDSPVKYRGVPVGRVSSIRIAPDGRLIAVELTISKEHAQAMEAQRKNAVATLSNVGITGAMFVELDTRLPHEPDLSPKLSFTPPLPLVASRPSDIKKLFQEIDTITKQIQSVDFAGISRQTLDVLQTMDSTLKAARIGDIANETLTLVTDVRRALSREKLVRLTDDVSHAARAMRGAAEAAQIQVAELGALTRDLRALVAANRPHVDTSLAAMAESARTLSAILDHTQGTIAGMGAGARQGTERLLSTLDALERTAANLELLSAHLKDQPSLLFFSAPPKPARATEEP